VDDGATSLTAVQKPSTGRQPQAAEPSDFGAGLVAVVVVPALEEVSADVDEVESEDELPDPFEDSDALVVPEPLCERSLELLPEPRPDPVLRRESLRESLR
jgi:hypothetical protein